VSWLDEGGFDVEDVDLIEHRFYQAFDGVLCCAVGTETGHAEGAGCRGEDEVTAVVLGAKMGERELDDMESAEEVCAELIAEVVVVLVFACTYDTCPKSERKAGRGVDARWLP
jgi:hypothetical protein